MKPHPKSQSFQEVQIQILQLGAYFYLALFLNPSFLLVLMIFPAVVDKRKAISGSTTQPSVAPRCPGPAVQPVRTPVSCQEETGGLISPFPGRSGEVRCVLLSG